MSAPLISYAQNFEDVMLWRALKDVQDGSYIDIGAHDPRVDSVSRLFYEHGWRGIHVEPLPVYCNALREDRPDETVIQAAVAEQAGVLRFFEIPDTGISTANPEIADAHRQRGFQINEIVVPSITLDQVFAQARGKAIHWLKIDVEGLEDQVLDGWGNAVARPWMVVVESTAPLTQQESYEQWEHYLTERGYSFMYFDGLNRFYLAAGHDDLRNAFNASPNVFDGFSLSGQASAPFCHAVQERLRNEHKQHAQQLTDQSEELHQQLVQLEQSVQASNQQTRQHEAELQQAQDAFAQSQQARQQEKETLVERERALGNLLMQARQQNHGETQALLQKLAQREQDFTQQLQQLQQESQKASQQQTQTQAELQRHIESARSEQLRLEREQRALADELAQKNDKALEALHQQHAEQFNAAAQRERELVSQLLLQQQRVQQATDEHAKATQELERGMAHALAQREQAVTEKLEAVRSQASKESAELARNLAGQQTALHSQHVAHEQALNQRLDAAQDHQRQLQRDSSKREQTLLEQGNQAKKELEILLRSQLQRERELAAQLLAAQQQSAREKAELARDHAQKVRELASQQAQREEGLLQQLLHKQREQEQALHLQHTEREAALNQQLQQLRQLLHRQQEEWAQLEQAFKNEVVTLQNEKQTLHKAQETQSHQHSLALNTKLEEHTHLLEVCATLKAELQAEVLSGQTASLQLRKLLAEVQHSLTLTHASFSWRMTEPLRKLAGLFSSSRYQAPPPISFSELATLDQGTQISTPPPPITVNHASREPTMQPPAQATALNMPTIASTLPELLAYHDQHFVQCAYRTLLGRAPDPEGLSYYLGRLRMGFSKISILAQLYRSPEGKVHAANLLGLDSAVKRYKRGQQPLIGWLCGLFYGIEGNHPTERKLRSIENQLGLLRDENNRRFNHTETMLDRLNQQVVQQTNPIAESKLLQIVEKNCRCLSQIETVLANLQHIVARQTQTDIIEPGNLDISDPRISAVLAQTQADIKPINEVSLDADSLKSDLNYRFTPTTPVVFPMPKGYRKIYYYVDHTIRCPVNTGMQRVTRRLGGALHEAGEEISFVKWDANLRTFVLLNHDELAYLSQWNGPTLSPKSLEEYTVPGTDAVPIGSHILEEGHWLVVPEVTHITYQGHPMTLDVLMEAKRLGLKTAFIYYDATPLRRAELNGMTVNHETYMQQLLLVDLVVPISNWSARDLVSFFHVYEKASVTSTPRIAAIPLPGESQLTPRVTVPATSHIASRLILSVGSITPHKNQLALLHAFEHFCKINPKTDWQLALVGNLHPDIASEITRATNQNSRIQYLEHVPDDQLDTLYRSCAFTVFPSVVEGFGLPILESLWYGKPCICAEFGAMAEVAEGGGCYSIDMRNGDELLRAITLLATKPGMLEKLSKEATERTITTWYDYGQCFIAQMDEAGDPLKQMGVIYYWVDHTSTYHSNSGIQRVVRGLAQALMAIGLKLVPVKWDAVRHQFYPPSQEELEHLAHWNGPHQSGWSAWIDPVKASTRDWILIPELTTYLNGTGLTDLKRFASLHNLRTAIIFHDAIPWKMRDIYPIEAADAHEQYMKELNEFDLILPNTQFTRGDLISFLSTTSLRTPSLENRIQASELPGEFLESNRTTKIKREVSPVTKILCVGTVEPRKNHLGLLQAFAEVIAQTSRPVELIIASGNPFPELALQVKQIIDTLPSVRWETGINDVRLRELYEECDFTVFPSLEEGFGLPILESLWYARPCVCRNSGAMAEVAEGGGCLTVETADPATLTRAILKMVENDELRIQLAGEAISRSIKTWHDYAREVATRMATERHTPLSQSLPELMGQAEFYDQFVNLLPRPMLSICITTYNRADWLSLNLKNLARLMPNPRAEIEIVVCDNTSSDHTPDVVQPYLQRADFRYYRNPDNVGMLGNLRVTAHHARGQYIWIVGDDDLIKPGGIEKVLQVIQEHPGIALVYLNYAYTRQDDATAVTDLDGFLNEATPISPPVSDILGLVSQISTESENFFTAIYCLVYRRDHALRAYTQNIEGRPFSTLLTCIPTTYYTLNFMMDEPAYWVGDPQLVVNLNVSWMKYAPLWILERIPEAYDLAERMGAEPLSVDRWRNHNLPGVVHFFREIYENDKESNMDYFSPSRLMGRIRYLDTFASQVEALRITYENGHAAGHLGAGIPPFQLFSNYENN